MAKPFDSPFILYKVGNYAYHDCPLVLGYTVTGGVESESEAIFRCKRERLIVECFNNNGHAAVKLIVQWTLDYPDPFGQSSRKTMPDK